MSVKSTRKKKKLNLRCGRKKNRTKYTNMYTHSSRDTEILFSGWIKKATKKALFWGWYSSLSLLRCNSADYVPGSLNEIPQQTVMRMKYDMVLKEKLMTNSFARHFAAQVKKKKPRR